MSPSAPSNPMTPNLVADVGGTNTRVALADGAVLRGGSIRRFANTEHPSLEAVLSTYLAQTGGTRVAGTCVAIAGPVSPSIGRLTNLDWAITPGALCEATGAGRALLLNDLQAQGHALDQVPDSHRRSVLPGTGSAPAKGATRLVIGLGTGFNAAPVYQGAAGVLVPAAEAGHTLMPQRDDRDVALARWLEASLGFASVEDVLSGRGWARLYHWHALVAGSVAEDAAQKPVGDIMAELAAGDPLAEAAARHFVSLFGRVAGALTLNSLPYGGVGLIGGVARAFAPYLDRFGFGAAFLDHGRFSTFLQDFPVFMVEDDYAALMGCAAHLHSQKHT
ncbi:glucokinase [Roseicitreum antarcticum]|uniref:Glucokinase n=1 Tax=Roseicitreum antarcticum TaxID=564137 RepID=A0A1H3BQK7_9RHOB|nr:glucokinase [Roseicitreum antarcticum]SDX43998.1 glucokinase [Roseicitreum antarcticum]